MELPYLFIVRLVLKDGLLCVLYHLFMDVKLFLHKFFVENLYEFVEGLSCILLLGDF